MGAAGALVLVAATPASAAAETLTVLSFNTWHDGSRVTDGFGKIADSIGKSGADVVCLQESGPGTAKRLAARLGWHAAEGGAGSVQIVSRHPIVRVVTSEGIGSDRFLGAALRLDRSSPDELMVFNIHLDYRFYGPYAARNAGATVEAVLEENARSDRTRQVRAALETMAGFLKQADERPVILAGDFNVPSHLDWTAATAASHGGIGPVPWPESMLVAGAGFIDAFRARYPDPAAEPGNTWSAIHKGAEPQDRIDFIYHSGKGLALDDSRLFSTAVETTVGPWSDGAEAATGNTWPSDHFAVLATYRIGAGGK